MKTIKEYLPGILLCLVIAWIGQRLGNHFPIVGEAVFSMLIGLFAAFFLLPFSFFKKGIGYSSKKLLQYAVILLGFGLNLAVVFETGKQSLPILVSTISLALLVSYFLGKRLAISSSVATLIGVGSAICGGSAIAATAPVIGAEEEEVAQAISVIVLFNVLAALLFPALGAVMGFPTDTGEVFGIFAGTAVNDTSSVTATATTWDSLYHLGSQTLDKAVTVKLTRTLAIIPITLSLAFFRAKHTVQGEKVDFRKIFPYFIVYFLLASLITTTLAVGFGMPTHFFNPVKHLSKFLISMAMAAIGLQTNLAHLIKKGGRPILLGFICWIAIITLTLILLHWLDMVH